MADAAAKYIMLGTLMSDMPPLNSRSREASEWLGKVYALVRDTDPYEAGEFKTFCNTLQPETSDSEYGISKIVAIIHRALGVLSLQAPQSLDGMFIPVGSIFDAKQAIGGIFKTAKRSILVIDPYLDKVFMGYAVLIDEGVSFQLLSDERYPDEGLTSLIQGWKKQYKGKRPIEHRFAKPHRLHERSIIVDYERAWLVTHSFNGLGVSQHTTIQPVTGPAVGEKIAAYKIIWDKAAIVP